MFATATVVVVGTGYVGTRFLEQHDNALGLSRSVHDLDTDDDLAMELPSSYTVLYTVPPSTDSLADVRLLRLLDKLTPKPQRFVYISTTGVYGNRDGALVDEETAVRPESDRARRRVAAEDALQSWGAQFAVDIVVLRVPGIYGPERLGIDRLRERAAVIAAEDCGPGNRIHVDDLLACCSAALSATGPVGIFNVGDGDHRSSTWFSNEVARHCGLPPPPAIRMAIAEREFSPMRMSFLRESRKVSTNKMRTLLGVSLRYANAEDGIKATLAGTD
jgi:nucleoside-diphosphate-sugar epimerase